MAIPFAVVARPNPSDRTLPARFFGNARSSGEVSLRQLLTSISERSTLTTMDTVAAMEALVQTIPEELLGGRIVRLGDLGTLWITLRSEGSDSAENFDSSLITQARVNFRPGKLIRNRLGTADFVRVE